MSPRGGLLLGNGAVARGLLEGGVRVATAYPGTPSTEILVELVRHAKAEEADVYTEWSVNEKVALDVAFAAAMAGKRAACAMKQVGLNVASDTLMSSAYTGVDGGLAIIVCDDPGPHSSQTEQDSRLFAMMAQVPVLDPATPREARAMAREALALSEKWKLPVIVRPTTRICHARAFIEYGAVPRGGPPAKFQRDPTRWAATPVHRLKLHGALNERLARIAEEFEASPFNEVHHADAPSPVGIVTSGVAASVVLDLLDEAGVRVPVLKIGTPFPFPRRLVEKFIARFERALVVEETMAVIELQISDRRSVRGRMDGTVPPQGELTPDVVHDVLAAVGIVKAQPHVDAPPASGRRPTMCPGCGHRAAVHLLHKAFPKAIFPSDIGCYTLAVNMRAIDTCIDMGASITVATGLYQAFKQDGVKKPIVATIGDSTFFHAGIPALLNARTTGARFVLVILDNGTVAMTGWQPTPASGRQTGGRMVPSVPIEQVVRGLGVEFVEAVDPYDADAFLDVARRAGEHVEAENGGVAVVIARHPCVLQTRERGTRRVTINDDCDGCRICLVHFECPALVPVGDPMHVEIDRKICTDCGACVEACPRQAIVEVEWAKS